MPFAATWMQLKIFILSEARQKEKDKSHVILLIMWNLKYGTNEYETKAPLAGTLSKPRLDLNLCFFFFFLIRMTPLVSRITEAQVPCVSEQKEFNEGQSVRQ